MQIEIKIEPTFSVRWPMLKIRINGDEVFNGACEPKDGKFFTYNDTVKDIKVKNVLELEHYDKDGKETFIDDTGEVISDRAIMLRSIKLDNFQVPDVILYDRSFEINWSGRQLREDANRPVSMKNNLYFGYNGTYRFEFGDDSAKEYYLNLIEKERIANVHNKKEMIGADGNKIEVFEFTGKMIDGSKDASVTIEDLYKIIQDEN